MQRLLALLALTLTASSCTVETKPAPSAAATSSAPHAAPATPSAPIGPLKFNAQPGWVVQTPSSAMRKAQYELPAAEGDSEPASLVVYQFPGGAGTFEANVERWNTQLVQPEGQRGSVTSANVKGLEVKRFDASGRYVAETSPGSGVKLDKADWRIVALVATAAEGTYQIKLVGPAKTVAHWMPSVEAFQSQLVP